MKKIGMITYHCVDNYGAVLQAYSLQETIMSLSLNRVEILDYRPYEITKNYSFSILGADRVHLKKIVSNILSYPYKKAKNKRFQSFTQEHINLSKETNNIAWEGYDYLITGSDQVWNPSITRLEPYYLNFPNVSSKKISYAASIGKDSLTQEELHYLGSSIKFVESISVREQSAVSIVKKLLPNKEVCEVLDPVFLKSKESWYELVKSNRKYSSYILIYVMEYNRELFELAQKLSKQENKQIIIVSPNANIKTIAKSLKLPGKVLFTEGPLEFLNLIYYADYICTNSFHGTAFSIIFNKKFVTVPHGSRNTRLENILSKFDISSQQLELSVTDSKDSRNILKMFEYDYNKVNDLLELYKQQSLDFLKRSLDV